MPVSASASDNAGIAKVEFLVDGVLEATDTSAPYGGFVSMDTYPDGSQHVIAARAVDTSGRVSVATRTVTVDKHVDLSVGTIPAYISSAAQSTLGIATDPDASMQCQVGSDPATACTGVP